MCSADGNPVEHMLISIFIQTCLINLKSFQQTFLIERNHISFEEASSQPLHLTCFPVRQRTPSSSCGFPEQTACCGSSSWPSSRSSPLPVTQRGDFQSKCWHNRWQCVKLQKGQTEDPLWILIQQKHRLKAKLLTTVTPGYKKEKKSPTA